MIYHWNPSQPNEHHDICLGMPPLGSTIEPGRTWWDSSVGGETRSETVVWEIFESIIALLAVEELDNRVGGGIVDPSRASWLLAS